MTKIGVLPKLLLLLLILYQNKQSLVEKLIRFPVGNNCSIRAIFPMADQK